MSLQFCISCRFITSVCKPQATLQFYSRIECDTHMKHHETRETHTNVGFTARSSGAPTKCTMRPILWDIEEISTFLDYSEPLRTSTLHKILAGLRQSWQAAARGLRDAYGLTLGLHTWNAFLKTQAYEMRWRFIDWYWHIMDVLVPGFCSKSPHKRWSCEIPAVLEAWETKVSCRRSRSSPCSDILRALCTVGA